ncbi:ABC transporter ATP-binding protein [Cohaesibacter gelatinilyticus]|uniref:Peptide/nickel transport system ATP-binding protein n=1 Tax=Cohaesibacter gelatinilyticus TaxID=372072 RepID=A0A285PI39_9HYPH|nr:ABC transporter ATP-binding protein [Cohaesibacter gelatinilyticus]SNZ21400.1 peptide/nickel transport system ATP-binding protein [Cohaesibacter gelatinilyticus]
MTLLDIKNMRVEFPGRHGVFTSVDDVSLSVAEGEILGLVGESGAGKSTVGNAVMGLLQSPGKMVQGEVLLHGERIDQLSKADYRCIRGKRVAMIFQDPMTSLNPIETIEHQLMETILTHLDISREDARKRAVDLLDQVGIPDPAVRIKQYPHQFSGGMRQRVVIALALCVEPELIIADEPTTALDVTIQAQILQLIKDLCRDRNLGVILVTHDMGVIAETADRVAVMYRGRLIEVGDTEQIMSDPKEPYTRSLIAAVPPSNRKIDRFPKVAIEESDGNALQNFDLQSHWLGQGDAFDTSQVNLLEVSDLHKRFVVQKAFFKRNRKYLDAINGISFNVKAGETFGLVGESGSGKSTVARVITGIHSASGGAMRFAGQDLIGKEGARRQDDLRRDIQMVFQDPYSSLNGRMKVSSIVAEPIIVNKLASSKEERNEVVMDLLELVGLGKDAARKYPHEFSGGQRQRISIARALATRPRFLICDEPTSALDVSIQAQILNLLKDLQDELKLTLLFISHDLPVIRQMCDRIGVMRHGDLVEVAETEALFEQPQHSYSQTLINQMPKFAK